jgi:hypothetical protein
LNLRVGSIDDKVFGGFAFADSGKVIASDDSIKYSENLNGGFKGGNVYGV